MNYQWVQELEISLKACNELAHFIGDVLEGFVSLLNFIDMALNQIDLLHIGASIGLRSRIVEPVIEVFQTVKNLGHFFCLNIVFMRTH